MSNATQATHCKEDVETIGWTNWNDAGQPVYSKRHQMVYGTMKTLCGQSITRDMDTDDGRGCHDDCKKCQKAFEKLI